MLLWSFPPLPRSNKVGLVAHEDESLGPGLLGLGQMEVHLVPVKVSVVRRAHALVEPEGSPAQDFGLIIINIIINYQKNKNSLVF